MNKLKNFPNVNYISIIDSESRRKKLHDEFKNYGVCKITPHIFKRFKYGDHEISFDPTTDFRFDESYLGAFTSHLKAIKDWYENTDEEYAFFCEDDISLETIKYWNFTWEEFFNSLPEDWECIQLSLIRKDGTIFFYFENGEVHIRNRWWDDWSCLAYLMSRKHAKKLIDTYYNEDCFAFEYRGTDKEYRKSCGGYLHAPTIETIIYTNFGDSKIYSFPLFVEDISFPTTVWENTGRHNYSHSSIIEWWKNKGISMKMTDLQHPEKNNSLIINVDSMEIKVLFFGRNSKDEVWEHDFILNDILPKKYSKKTFFLSLDEVRNSSEHFDVFVYSARDPNIYSWGYMPTYDEVLECVLKTKPKIIIQLSDEYKNEDLGHHNKLSNYCELFLRQYNHQEYRNSKFETEVLNDNIVHIPLGYCNLMSVDKIHIIPTSEKKYNWSFIGKIKDWEFCFFDNIKQKWVSVGDRTEMTESFKSNIQDFFFAQEGIDKDDLIQIYINSIFVPCGRGNSSLDCFRLYEASMCGAIPVVVGSSEEIQNTFAYEEKPPWVFAESWDQAVKKCKELLNDKDNLQEVQNDLLFWWNARIHKIQDKVNLVLDKIEREDYSYKLKNFPPINFISVDKSEHRRKLLNKKFSKYNLTNIRPHIFEVYNDEDHHYIGESFRELNGIGRGPTTSHLKAIKDWYFDTEEEYAFFCEDDVSFETVKYWNFTWEEFFNALPEDWRCVQLCWVREGDMFVFSNDGVKLRHRCWCDWSACAYLITRDHAKKLISHYYRNGSFNLDFVGNDSHVRPKWAKDPVAETIIFSPLGNPKNSDINISSVYGFPLFVEDFYNCESDLLKYDCGNVLAPQRVRNEFSYNTIIDWWKMEGKNLTIKDIIDH